MQPFRSRRSMTTEQTDGVTRFSEADSVRDAKIASVIDLMNCISEHYTVLSRERMYHLLFYSEAVYYRNNGERITQVDWKPYAYGMWSETVETVLDTWEDRGGVTGSMLHHNSQRSGVVESLKEPTTYDYTLGSDVTEFMQSVFDETDTVATDELAGMIQQWPVYQNTAYDTAVDFSQIG